MSLFKRSVVAEILSHGGVVISTLMVVWLSVLLVRLLGDAASGDIGADVVLGLATFSSITALPVILSVSLFIAVLTTVTRSYRESEMVVWFASGLSLSDWIRPVMRCAVPVALLIAILTMYASPWAYRQIAEYRQRYEQRSDLTRIAAGQFIETERGARVFFAEEPTEPDDETGRVLARVVGPEWLSIMTSQRGYMETAENGDKFLVLSQGHRYDIKPGQSELRLFDFEDYGLRIENKKGEDALEQARQAAEMELKARRTSLLLADNTDRSRAHIMWRLALPIAALNLALLAIPLGASNPRLGRSGDILLAGLVGMLYMNLINLSRSWISGQQLSFGLGVWLVHALFAGLMVWMMWMRLRIRRPRGRARSAPAV